jgi:tRNA threonylcarbamoyladenosine biosynthesis protein TsaB
MHVLVIHACLDPMFAAVLETASGRLDVRRDRGGAGSAERLPLIVMGVLADAACAPAAIDRIAVTTGPGGFTGVRTAVAFARGFAVVHGVPVIGISTFAAIAASARIHAGDHVAGEHAVAVALDDGRGNVALQCCAQDGTPLGDAVVVDAETARTLVPAGAIAAGPRAGVLGLPIVRLPGDGEIAPVALAMIAAASDGASPPPDPIYLRPADAIPPKPSGLVARPDHPPPGRQAGSPGSGDQ